MIGKRIFGDSREDLFLAGIIHDIGLIVEDQVAGELLREACKIFSPGKKSLVEAEREIIGADHCAVGLAVAKEWKMPKDVLDAMWNGEGSADEVIESKGLKQITDSSAIEVMVDEVIANNPGQFAELKAGKDKLMGFFVGQVMKASGGKASPEIVNNLLKKHLEG